jgi:hypothetical protein
MKLKTNRPMSSIKDNKIAIYNTIVGGMVETDIDLLEQNIEKIINKSESEYSQWGGKFGFMKYLENLLKEEDRYFRKNSRKITLLNSRYQRFCDDMVLYEMIRHVVTGDIIQVAELQLLEKVSLINKSMMQAKPINNMIN